MTPETAPEPDAALVQRVVEAALLASSQPLSVAELQALFTPDSDLPGAAIVRALEALQQACADRGVELVEVASGFRYQVRTDIHPWIARLWSERPQRYTRATLEILALIAYRQPVTRGEIEQIRGVAVSSNIIKALEEREWIRVLGHRDVPGKPALFGTTRQFLDYFNLKSLDQLPPLAELRDLFEIEPQLPLDPVAPETSESPSLDDAGDIVISPVVTAIATTDTSISEIPSDPEDADPLNPSAPEHTA